MGYVYLAGVIDGCHKIGNSGSPGTRVRAIGNEFKATVSLVAVIPTTKPRWFERYLHTAFAHRRMQGEWFRLTPEDVDAIRAITSVDGICDIPDRVVSLHDANAIVAADFAAKKKEVTAKLRVVFEACDEPTRRAIYFAAAKRGVSHSVILNEIVRKHLRNDIKFVTEFMAKEATRAVA